MKIHYEDNLKFQKCAIDSVVRLFCGQEIYRPKFIGSNSGDNGQFPLGITENKLGIGNKLELENVEILENVRAVQLQNGLPLSEELSTKDFTVEMETGTGKTYVYLRTIFELHRLYGFVKFAIVVPSIAMKERTFKALEMTREHFESLYPESRGYEYYAYDSLRLGRITNFATNSDIQIMIVTVAAMNKIDTNNLYKENEITSGEKPIEFVRAANPILIVVEPQRVDGGLDGKGRNAMEMMNPLCTLRYSAKHVHKHHMVYRLDAVEAYERQLVKQIEVASVDIEGGHNKPYVKLLSTHNDRGTLLAKVQAEFLRKDGLRREIVSVEDGDDLEVETGRDIYKDFRIGTITKNKRIQKIELSYPGGEIVLQQDDEFNGVNPLEMKRLMIRRTIKEHLEKELRFKMQKLDVKVLSLFFIDSVEYYRKYDAQGNIIKGKYAAMFEKEFRNLAMQSGYRILFEGFNPDLDIEHFHDGYFSIDKKGNWTETDENNKVNRESTQRAYNLIMKEKEKLLSFDNKLKFIFTHSSLKEGWDNPNVFQICALREMGTERERRKTIGRGMRLCVNKEGKRLLGSDINTLTVITSESFETFEEKLQSEIEEDTGIRFGVVDRLEFASVLTQTSVRVDCPLGAEDSTKLWKFLHSQGYINMYGEILKKLRDSLEADKLNLPEEFKMIANQIKTKLRRLAGLSN